jgi:maltooligosyltrehalose synthase
MAVGWGLHEYDGKLPDLSKDHLNSWAAKAKEPETRHEFENARKTAEAAISDFVEKLWKHVATSEFALGKEKFQKVLWVNDRLEQPLEEVLHLALDDLESNLE